VLNLPLDFIDYLKWRHKLKTWIPVSKHTDQPCWLCDEMGDCTMFQSPDWTRTSDWAYDICPICVMKLGLKY
jgi:hypothetical protein